MACCLTAPSHYLNQCWCLISEVLWQPSSNSQRVQKLLFCMVSLTILYFFILLLHLPSANDLIHLYEQTHFCQQEALAIEDVTLKLILQLNLTKSRSFITPIVVTESVWNFTQSAYCLVYPGYFREPHWKSIGLPQISRLTWLLWEREQDNITTMLCKNSKGSGNYEIPRNLSEVLERYSTLWHHQIIL